MKKHLRVVSALLAFLFVAVTAPATKAFATSRSQNDAISWVQSQVGKSLDMDGAYGAQCVDLILAYYDYLGVSRSSGNGADYATNSLPSGWQRIQGAQPQKGDILVYSGNSSNPYGHVAIYESDYVTYHQNFNSHSYVEKVTYRYNGLANAYWGIIRPNWNDGGASTWPFTAVWDESTTDHNTCLHATISGRTIQSAGFYISTSPSYMPTKHSENVGKYTENIWYDLNSECGITLYSGTTYYYKFYVTIDGNEYQSEVKTLTTTGSKVVTSIKIKQNPTKLTYNVGDTFSSSGMVITATYEDGSTKDFSSGYSCSPTTLSTSGKQKITVSYGGKSTALEVTVNKVLSSVSVKTKPSKVVYHVGETLNTDGLVLTAKYNDNTTADVTSGFSCTPTTLNTAGTQTITVTYSGKTTSFDVTVKQNITSIFIVSAPTKTTYNVGETLNTDGLKLVAVFYDGTTQNVTSGFTCTPTTLNTPGTQTITVEYGEKTTTFDVTVSYAVTSVFVISPPTKTSYNVGETINTSGLELIAVYQDGTTQNITSGFTCSPTVLNTVGTQTVTVTYSGKTTTFNVNVSAAASFTASPASPQAQNTTIRLTATGGAKYKFYCQLGSAWTRIQDVSTSNTCSWKPSASGTYNLYVDIMDNSGNVIECRKMTYVIQQSTSELNAVMTAAYPSPQNAGTTIKLSVKATGGTGSYTYKFYSECNGVWTKLWDYDTKNIYNWHATTVGTHTVYCDVKDSSGKVVCTLFKYQIVKGSDFVADLNANRISGQYVGTEIRLLANSSNGSGTVQYKFYYELDGNWVSLQAYSTKDYYLWTPSKAGFYNLYLDAKDSSGKTASKRLCITIEDGSPLKIQSFTANPSAPSANSTVTLKATTTGGLAPVTYKFYYEKNGSWTKLQDFSTSSTCTWRPTSSGTYHVYVDAFDGKKNTQCLMITVNVA